MVERYTGIALIWPHMNTSCVIGVKRQVAPGIEYDTELVLLTLDILRTM